MEAIIKYCTKEVQPSSKQDGGKSIFSTRSLHYEL